MSTQFQHNFNEIHKNRIQIFIHYEFFILAMIFVTQKEQLRQKVKISSVRLKLCLEKIRLKNLPLKLALFSPQMELKLWIFIFA